MVEHHSKRVYFKAEAKLEEIWDLTHHQNSHIVETSTNKAVVTVREEAPPASPAAARPSQNTLEHPKTLITRSPLMHGL